MPHNNGVPATVLRAGMTESQKGTLGISLTFELDSGTIDHVLWVTPNTHDRVLKDLNTLGLSQARIDDPDTFEDIDTALRGARCSVVIEDEEYKGEVRARVKWINDPQAQASEDAVARIYGLLASPGKAKVAPVPINAAPRAPEPPPNTPFSDDDVPF
jgi:hypothetical protein